MRGRSASSPSGPDKGRAVGCEQHPPPADRGLGQPPGVAAVHPPRYVPHAGHAAVAAPGLAVTSSSPAATATPSMMMGSRSAAIRRMITPDDVAAAVLFLVSDRAQAVTGVALPVDGGTMLGVW
jgi:hypothetical protein